MDDIPPQNQGHSPGPGISLCSETSSLCSGRDTPSAQQGSLLQKTLVFCFFFEACRTGLGFLQGATYGQAHSETNQARPGPCTNPWLGSGVTAAQNKCSAC